jgi:hypothetical protein
MASQTLPAPRNFPFMEDLFFQLPKISIDSASHTVYLLYSKLFHAGQSRKRGLGGFTTTHSSALVRSQERNLLQIE